MIDTQYAIVTRRRESKIPVQCKSVISKTVMWLALLLIGILAVPAVLLISLMIALWELADAVIRRIDGLGK